MELEEFIKKTLAEIFAGIVSANDEIQITHPGKGRPFGLQGAGFGDGKNKDSGYVTFDIAVTASTQSKGAGGGKVNIHVASMGGTVEASSSDGHISRIKFTAAINYPVN